VWFQIPVDGHRCARWLYVRGGGPQSRLGANQQARCVEMERNVRAAHLIARWSAAAPVSRSPSSELRLSLLISERKGWIAAASPTEPRQTATLLILCVTHRCATLKADGSGTKVPLQFQGHFFAITLRLTVNIPASSATFKSAIVGLRLEGSLGRWWFGRELRSVSKSPSRHLHKEMRCQAVLISNDALFHKSGMV